MSNPKAGETLILYIAVSKRAIRTVLARDEGKIKYPVYYTSKALHEAELRYSPLEKLAYTVIMAARKLWPYFLEYPIEVLTDCPLKQVLQKPDTSGKVVKWVVELGQFDIKYRPHTSIQCSLGTLRRWLLY